MKRKNIKGLIHSLGKELVEQLIQNPETSTYISSKDKAQELRNYLEDRANEMLEKDVDTLLPHFQLIGEQLYIDYHLPSYTWLSSIDHVKESLLYAIHHNIIDLDQDELLLRIGNMTNGLCKGYLNASVRETLSFVYSYIGTIDTEIDILIHEHWYKQFLNSVLNNLDNLPVLIYEESKSYKWINSLEFKLLMKPVSFETESNILIFTHAIYNLARDIVYFIKKEDYRNAYHFSVLIDQKINIVSSLLEGALVAFNQDNLHHFFSMFAEVVLFDKQYSYFLTVSTDVGSPVSKYRNHKTFQSVYRQLKLNAKSSQFHFTGTLDNGNALHLLMHYHQEEEIHQFIRLLQDAIEKTLEQKQTLFVPRLIIRAAETEPFSGMTTDKLQLLAMQMASVKVELPHYLLKPEECHHLRQHIERDTHLKSVIFEKVKQGDFEIHFEPIVKIQPDKVQLVYCEVLTRIIDNNKLIEAEQFIETIYQQKLGAVLDKQVFDKLANQAEAINRVLEGVSVNLFPESFKDERVMSSVKNCLEHFAKCNLLLIIEITEYNLFENYQILESLLKLYPETLKISVDDFGSGYSSLASLIKLSQKGLLYAVKIDGSLTKNILNDNNSYEVVKMALTLSEKLGVQSIIEFVENKLLLEKLKTLSSRFYAQGYYFGKAVALNQVASRFASLIK